MFSCYLELLSEQTLHLLYLRFYVLLADRNPLFTPTASRPRRALLLDPLPRYREVAHRLKPPSGGSSALLFELGEHHESLTHPDRMTAN